MKEETRHTGECEGRESPLSIYTHGIPPGSLQDLFSHCLQKYGTETETETNREGEEEEKERGNARREKKKGETAQCARGSRDIVTPLHPFADAFRSHRNLGCSSLFLASRACENSSVQDAIRARGVVEDVQETSYRANYLRLTTLPVRSVQNSSRLPQNRFVPTIC